ncbi:hypothetical protein LCGC14_1756820 [marine sediment metagenome]|uniref:Uncharacterized protein n=1 Tax=marine sediment metagenome TaxID=412755 RepID=A0A0F9H2A5_9ZZZZ
MITKEGTDLGAIINKVAMQVVMMQIKPEIFAFKNYEEAKKWYAEIADSVMEAGR